jgi:hypothetical protein
MDPSRKVLNLYGHYYLEEVVEVQEQLVILAVQEQLEILELRGLVLFLLLVSLVI